MSERLTIAEQRNKRKGRNYSIAIHVIILLLLFFFGTFKDDPDESIDDQYAVAIDFTLDQSSNSTTGQEEAGARPEQAEEEERMEEAPEEVEEVVEEVEEEIEEEIIEDEVIQEAPVVIEPDVEEVVEEESPVEAFEEEIVVEKPQKTEVPKKKVETPASKPSDKPVKVNKPSTKPKTNSGNGTGNSNTSNKPSTGKPGTGKTDSGPGSGKDNTGNDGNSGVGTGGTGHGEYDDSGNGIFGRRIIKSPSLGSIMGANVTGKVVIKMCVNPRGEVVHTELNRKETTITDRTLLRNALRVAKNYLYEKDIDAPAEQCGKFTFKLDINKLIGN